MARDILAFDAAHLLERGTEVALYDYAHFAETLLGCRSRILCPAGAPIPSIDKFRARFSVMLYRDRFDLEAMLRDARLYYRITDGTRPAELPPRPAHGRLGIHAVFRADQPHGDVYAAVSDWVATERGSGQVPVVPHMVHLPDVDDDLREQLGIPRDAVVLGRHGGFDTFNIPWVHEVVRTVIDRRADLWLLFLNTRPFADHPRIVHLAATTDMVEKTRFINSCDAMLHARAEGESFGLSVGEFSIRNKPVMTWLDGYDRYHVEVLGAKGLFYRTPEDLFALMLRFEPIAGDWDAYSARFAPEPVMRDFARVFLEAAPVDPAPPVSIPAPV